MAQNVGQAYVEILPSTRGISKNIESDLGGAFDGAEKSASKRFSGLFTNVGRWGATAVGVIGTAVGALALKGGISRALAIENAEAKLTGLGHSAESVTAIMGDALKSVKGTAFGLGDAASVAASMVASGVTQGEQLEGVLKTVADTATISGRTLTDIGAIFGSVAARGKLQGDDMLQLMSSGVPVLQFLADHLGTTSAAVSKMVSKGEIDFETFAAAMKENLGGAALASGETFTGALSNVYAALGRMGEAVATPALAALKGIFNDAIPAIDSVTSAISPLVEALAGKLAPVVENLSTKFFDMVANLDFSKLSDLAPILAPIVGAIAAISGSSIAAALGPLGRLLPVITGPMGALLGFVTALIATSPELRTALGDTLSAIADVFTELSPLLVVAAEGMAALAEATASGLASALETVNPMLESLAGWLADNMDIVTPLAVGIAAFAAAFKTWGAIVGLVNGVKIAWAGLTAVFTASPIGLVITAIAALVAGLVYFFTQTETGRKVWETVWSAIKTAAEAVVNWLIGAWEAVVNAWNNVADFFSGLWDSITSGGEGVGNWFSDTFGPMIAAVWEGIQSVVGGVVDWFSEHVGPVFQAFGELLAAVWERVTQAAEIWWTLLQTVFQLVIEGWQWLWEGVTAAWDAVGAPALEVIQTLFNAWLSVLQGIWSVVAAAWSVLWEGIKAAWDTIGAVLLVTIQAAWEHVKGVLSGIWNVMQSVFTGVWNTMKVTVETILAVIKGVINTVTAAIRGDWSGVWEGIKSVFTSIWDGMKTVVENSVNTIGNIIGTIKDTVLNVFSNAGSWLLDAGKKIIQGLIDGIGNMFSKVGDKLGELTDLLPSWKGPPKRDERLLTAAGQKIMQSLISGFEDEEGNVRDYLRALTGDISAGIDVSADFARSIDGRDPLTVSMPSELVVVDVNGELIGRMAIEGTNAAVAVVNAR